MYQFSDEEKNLSSMTIGDRIRYDEKSLRKLRHIKKILHRITAIVFL